MLSKKRICAVILLALSCAITAFAQKLPKLPRRNINFIAVNDMGANKPEMQKPVADVMAEIAATRDIDFVILPGDPIHGEGVASVDDPVWDRRFQNVYSDEVLKNLDWYPVCGNHEYRGNPQAVVGYSTKDPRWKMPSLYYSFHKKLKPFGGECLFVMLDTAPMVRVDKSPDPEKTLGVISREREWLDSVLTVDHSKWKFVIGHHPVYAKTEKMASDLVEMKERVGDRIEEAGVDFYVCGHIHNFQYIRPEGTKVNYIINASASVTRESGKTEGTVWNSNGPGITVFSVSPKKTIFYFIDSEGKVLYSKCIKKN